MVERSKRITESWEIGRIRATGVSASCGPLVARVAPNQTDPPRNRYTVIAGKRIGKSHERNRCKRITREAVRLLDPELRQGYDLVIWLRGGIDEMTGLDVARHALQEIARKAKLIGSPT
jgi:ribonuclease P protein component